MIKTRDLKSRIELVRLLVLWALGVEIRGRHNAQWSSRRVLIYLALNAKVVEWKDAVDIGEKLWGQSRVVVSEIARELAIPAPTVYTALDRLVRQGLIVRRTTPHQYREYTLIQDTFLYSHIDSPNV